jgi:hypothetical protein
MRFYRATLTLLLLIVLTAGASAQGLTAVSLRRAAPGPIARAARAHAVSPLQLDRLAAQEQQRPATPRRRGPGRIVAGAAVGAVGGFFAGGYLGAIIDGDCGGCDDPGLKGALIGAPIGATVGGILGGKFLF